MKLRTGLLMIGLLLATLAGAGEIATFDKATHGVSMSLWHDRMIDLPNENAQITHQQTENLDFSVTIAPVSDEWLYWFWTLSCIFAGFTLFMAAKWSYLAIMLTEYESFVWDMETYYASALVENYHFPYHACRASHYLWNFRVWTVRDALNRTLDVFSHHEFNLWQADNTHRPKLRY